MNRNFVFPKLLRFALCVIAFSPLTGSLLTGPAYADLEARAAILMNLKSESILYVQDENVKIPPASLAKIMTMYVAMDLLKSGDVSLSDDVKISKAAAAQIGSRMELQAGEVVPLGELLKGVAVASGNDASVAVAEHLSGSAPGFVRLMNAKAKELGLKSTTFRNPHGLPHASQVTTARDMLVLSKRYIEDHPEALPYHKIPFILHNGIVTTNKNPLLRTHPDIVDGLKTGWIRSSKHNLIVTAASGDIRLISVVLGAPSSRDLTEASTFLIEAGFRTVESGGENKVRHQLETLAAEKSSEDARTNVKRKAPSL